LQTTLNVIHGVNYLQLNSHFILTI